MSVVTGRRLGCLSWLFGTLEFQATFHLMAEWLYSEAGNLDLAPPDLCLRVAVPHLWQPVRAFIANTYRVRAFWKLSPHLIEQASSHVLAICRSVFAVTGRPFLVGEESKNKELIDKINSKMAEDLAERFEATGEIDKASGYDFTRALSNFELLLSQNPEMNEAIYAAFCSQLTSAWTAWETLATDLWEAAINYHPATLAKLSGKRERISKLAGSKSRDDTEEGRELSAREFEPRLADFETITQGTFNASALMGTLLKKECKFQTLAGIRRAYSAAFSNDWGSIDAALSNRSLDKLNLVRNLILHKAGVMDAKFAEQSATIPDWKIEKQMNDPIPLDGKIVQELINPVFQLGIDLIYAVDKWVRPKDSYPIIEP